MKQKSAIQCIPSCVRNKFIDAKNAHTSLRIIARRFAQCHLRNAHSYNAAEQRKTFLKAAKSGLLGISISKKYGGQGRDATSSVIVHHELSKQSPGFCLSYLAHAILFAHNFANSANPIQKRKILPRICSGRKIGAFALSEKNAGTDVLNMKTTAMRDRDFFLLNGSKIWITNGPIADYFLVYAKIQERSKVLVSENKRHQSVGCFLLKRGTKGFHVGRAIAKCGMQPAVMCELAFCNVRIHKSALIGPICDGWHSLMHAFKIERLCLAAIALGIADRSLEEMVKFAAHRKTFGRPIYQYGQIQKYIADGYTSAMAAHAFIYAISTSQIASRAMTDAAKLFAAPIAKQIADNAIQVCGAMGYSRKMQLEQFWRDAKLLEIGGGTIEAHQKNIVKDLLRDMN